MDNCTSAQDLLKQLPILYIYIVIREIYDRQPIHENPQRSQTR